MASRRWLTTLGAIGLALAVATPTLAQGNSGGKKGGGGKKTESVSARQVSIDDTLSSQLKSDGMERDEYGNLIPAVDANNDGVADTPVIYQDHRIEHFDEDMMSIGPYSDPCVRVGSNDSQFDFDRGDDGDKYPLRGCNAAFPDDGRTVTIEFKPVVPNDPNDPARLACEVFKFLKEPVPDGTWGDGYPSEWQTRFEWNDPDVPGEGCKVTPSAGEIITEPDSSQIAANLQFYADPFATVSVKVKGKRSEVDVEFTSLNINFRIDRKDPGEPNAWQIKSQEADLKVDKDLTNGDVRTISAVDGQLFDLCLAGSGCVAFGFTLPLQIRYERFEVGQ